MPFKKLFLLCSLCAALLTPLAFASVQQKVDHTQASQRVKRVIDNMSRAIEVYKSSGSLKGARRHVHTVEEEVTALTFVLPADSPLLNALEVARNSLTHASLISHAHRGRRRIPDEELESLSAICEEYGVPPGRGGRLQTGECVRVIMRELRRRHREAFLVASREGADTSR